MQEEEFGGEVTDKKAWSLELHKLTLFTDQEGLIRVKGRLQRMEIPFHQKHPIVVARDSSVAMLILRYYHERTFHQGKHHSGKSARAWILDNR